MYQRPVGARGRRTAVGSLVAVAVTYAVTLAGPVPASAGPARAAAAQAEPAIAFTRFDAVSEDFEIWTMDRAGTNQRRLTSNGVGDVEPAWSPDGARIAWVRRTPDSAGSDIWVMNADGSDKRRLTRHEAQVRTPTWSPDGTRLAFEWDYRIWVMNADGSAQHQISPAGPGILDEDPDWSPDGSTIAFISNGGPNIDPFDIWTMRADGSERAIVRATGVWERDVQWSPDGTRLAYTKRDAVGGRVVSVMHRDGTKKHRVIEQWSGDPTWSPGGRFLVFSACLASPPCGLYRSDLHGDDLRRVGFRPQFPDDGQPDFRPVG